MPKAVGAVVPRRTSARVENKKPTVIDLEKPKKVGAAKRAPSKNSREKKATLEADRLIKEAKEKEGEDSYLAELAAFKKEQAQEKADKRKKALLKKLEPKPVVKKTNAADIVAPPKKIVKAKGEAGFESFEERASPHANEELAKSYVKTWIYGFVALCVIALSAVAMMFSGVIWRELNMEDHVDALTEWFTQTRFVLEDTIREMTKTFTETTESMTQEL